MKLDYKTDLIKATILEQFKSIREFSTSCGIPYTTIKSALDKGIGGTSVETVIKICETLHLDMSELHKPKNFSTSAEDKAEKLSAQEHTLIEKYRQLDQRGKQAVLDTIDRESSYIAPQKHNYSALANDALEIASELSICPISQRRSTNKE